MGRDYTGWWVDKVPGINRDGQSYAQITAVAELGHVAFNAGRPTFRSERYDPWRERLLLPLTTTANQVDIVLAITVYRALQTSDK